MEPWNVYEFLDDHRRSTIRAWLEKKKVQKDQVALFRAKIDGLRRGGPDLNPGLIEGPIKKKKLKITGIYKMKIKGNKGFVQLRPMLCHGPFNDDKNTITLLLGAIEKDGVLKPEDYLERSDHNRRVLLNDRTRRRILRIPRDIEA